MKIIKLKNEERERIMKEVEMITQLDNPMLTRYVDSFLQEKKFHIIMEFATGNKL